MFFGARTAISVRCYQSPNDFQLVGQIKNKAGSLDIMKDPTKAIDLINEYANGGFYYIMKMMQDQSITNDLEWVKQEIFMR